MKRSGKDTVANLFAEAFVKRGKTAGVMGFADALRSMMMTLNPIVEVGYAEVYSFGREIPEVVTTHERYAEVVQSRGYDAAKEVDEVRRLLQVFGTEVIREQMGDNVWADTLRKRAMESEMDWVMVPDTRFVNEHAMIRDEGGIVIRVDRPAVKASYGDRHASETEWLDLDYDHLILNNGSIGELSLQVDAIVASTV